jgi:hypothetical protein
MTKIILFLGLWFYSLTLFAQEVVIITVPYGSGSPGQTVSEPAVETYPGSGLYHAPGYMPGYPTAGAIFPRVVDVNCTEVKSVLVCNGYNWLPIMGRGEYLLFRPHLIKPPVVEPPVIIYKEVPIKKGKG